MNESTPIEQSIQEVIQNIFTCSGEPYSISDAVVQVMYKHIRFVATRYAQNLKTDTPKLQDFVQLCHNKPLELLRIGKYFMILSTSNELASATQPDSSNVLDHSGLTDPDDDTQSPEHLLALSNDLNRKTSWVRFVDTCAKAQIDIPSSSQDLFELELQHTPPNLVRGRRLRLTRIDARMASSSSVDYELFAKLRQSASLLKFVRRRLRIEFWHWIFHPSDRIDLTQMNLTNPDVREGIRILAYLLTSHVWDVIDMALSRRQILKIDMKSPLTPIELKESVRQLQKSMMQTSAEL